MQDKTKGWDDELDDSILELIEKWQGEFSSLSRFRIPRWLKSPNTLEVKPQLHIFSDASKEGYGYVAYRRAQKGPHVDMRFLLAKSRVIPSNAEKTRHHNSIPRFELTGCKIAADFYEDFRKEAGEEYENVFFWSDSTCALRQIRTTHLRQDTFVANRLSIIRAKTDIERWFYVPTKDNPADIVSRGLAAHDDKNWDIFHNGPLFLRSPEWEEPKEAAIAAEEVTIAAIAATVGALQNGSTPAGNEHPVLKMVERYGKWTRKVRILAWIRKGINKWIKFHRDGCGKEAPALTTADLKQAEVDLFKAIQTTQFSVEMAILTGERIFTPQHRINLT